MDFKVAFPSMKNSLTESMIKFSNNQYNQLLKLIDELILKGELPEEGL